MKLYNITYRSNGEITKKTVIANSLASAMRSTAKDSPEMIEGLAVVANSLPDVIKRQAL